MEASEYDSSSLHSAARSGDVDQVRELLQHGKYDVNSTDSKGRTPLHYASEEECLAIVEVLMKEYEADQSIQDVDRCTALMLAALAGHGIIAEFMLCSSKCPLSCDPTLTGCLGESLLHNACRGGSASLVQTLIREYKADVNARNDQNDTPLHVAAYTGKAEVALMLIRYFSCDPSLTGNLGNSLLHNACRGGSISLVQALIREYKADINFQNEENNTPLHVAACNGKAEVALMLIEDFNCDPTLTGFLGESLLYKACRGGSASLVQTLIREYKAVNARNDQNDTPLHVAAYNGKAEVALMLIKDFNCDPTLTGCLGESLLHKACRGGSASLVQTLIREYKADVNARNDQNDTPLHVAAYTGKAEVALMLIQDFSCDPTLTGYFGESLLHCACRGGSASLVQTLICEYKADIHARNEENNIPLHVAAYSGKDKIALMLIRDFNCDPTLTGSLGESLLHKACQGGSASLVQTLINCNLVQRLSPLVADDEGNTALHCAAKYDELKCTQALIEGNAPILIRNGKGQTVLDVAQGSTKTFLIEIMKNNQDKLLFDYTIALDQARKKYSGSHHITRLFVMGYPGAGKSSLIESLKRENFLQSLRKVSESSVPPHTSGIIPSIYCSRHYGRVLFYDYAGDAEYYSSHAAFFQKLSSSQNGDNIFLVVVDLREAITTIEATLHYWFCFIQHQRFDKPSIIVVGSHFDSTPKNDSGTADKVNLLANSSLLIKFTISNFQYFTLDSRDPRSNQISKLKAQIAQWITNSSKYYITEEASLMLGLIEKDFSAVTACSIHTLSEHIKQIGVCLPTDFKHLHPIIHELHEVGLCVLLGDSQLSENCQVLLKISELTTEVHKLLFSRSSVSDLKKDHADLATSSLDFGILSEQDLTKILPAYITCEHLTYLQYCHCIKHSDVHTFPSLEQEDPQKSFLFFPALCSVDKSEVPWENSSTNSFSIGWLALCTDVYDYFPPRFLHALLLRLVFQFALSVPKELQTLQATSEHSSRRCTVWKKGVFWKTIQGVDCMVEIIATSKVNNGVVVLTKTSKEWENDCITLFNRIIHCVMEAKAEFCYSTKPLFFLLDSIATLTKTTCSP